MAEDSINVRIGRFSPVSLTTFLQKKHGLSPLAAANLAEKIMRDKAERAKAKKVKLEKAQLTMDLGEGAGEVATHPSDEVEDVPF